MANLPTCLKCGKPLAADARQGFCPRCLFLQASAGIVGLGACSRDGPSPEDGSSEVAPPRSASPLPESFGDYELLEEIGHGGMGVVYRARQRSLDRVVAIKMMAFAPDSSPELVKRFRAEAVSAASLHHPNIVAIHEVGIQEGRHFFVMDYVEGQSLAQRISDLRSWISDFRQSARWLQAVAEAVHYAHERGILHRDLKPSNVLIDAEDQPHVVDFGLARRLEGDSELTVTGQVLGSPHYLPPEQAAGHRARVSRRTDVYALGATLYHLLTGRPPFQAESLAQTLDLVLHADPVAPRLLNPTVSRDLETICLKCLEKEPSRRYATAQELADELARFQAGEPIQARPPSPTGKVWRWCRRKPSLAAAMGVALLSLLVGVVGIALQWRRAEVQRARAEGSELSLQRRTYTAEINSAQLALRDSNPGGALELLNRQRPSAESEIRNPKSELDRRGFEWRYLWQQCQSGAEAVIGKLPSRIRSLEVSADGQWLFAGSQGGAPRLWDLSTGEPVSVAGEADWAWGAFSPDSRLLLACAETAESYGKILVWDLQARKRLEPILDPRPIATMAFSADGRRFGYGVHQPPWGRGLVVLDFPSRQKVHELVPLTPMGSLDHGWDWVFTRDGRSVIFSENDPDCRIGLCDLAGGIEPQHFPGHREPITAMAMSPDGQTLATGAGYTDTAIRLWQVGEVRSFRPLHELSGHQGWITALRFSPDGRTLASAGADQTWRLWDVPTWTPLRVSPGLPTDVLRLRFSLDGARLFTGSRDGTIHRWALAAQPVQPQPTTWRTAADLDRVVVAPGANRFAGLQHGEVCLGKLQGETPPNRLRELGTNNTCLLFSSDGQSLFVGSRSGEVQVWSLDRHQLLRCLPGAAERVNQLCQDPQGQVLVVAQTSADFVAGRPYPATRIGVWGTAEWHQQQSWIVPFGGGNQVSTDGRWLAVDGGTRAIVVRSLSDSPQTHNLPFPGEPLGVAFSPDGRLLAAANLAGTVKVWEVPTFGEGRERQAHAHPVRALTFSPDSRRLATAGDGDQTIKLWDVDTWQELIRLPHERVGLRELLFSADGNQLVVTTSSGDLLIWRTPSFAEIEQRLRQPAEMR
ncbi:MAG TPA: protein kinase [Verrucomicrobiota bacterium]|nr:protein kinase [Verrucomicrobiota bacterium]